MQKASASAKHCDNTIAFQPKVDRPQMCVLAWSQYWSDDFDIRNEPSYSEDVGYLRAKNKVSRPRLSKVRTRTEQTDIALNVVTEWFKLIIRCHKLNRHLAIMKIHVRSDPTCSAYGEDEETTLHYLGCCWANSMLRHTIMGSYCLQSEELGRVTPHNLLRFARASKRFQ